MKSNLNLNSPKHKTFNLKPTYILFNKPYHVLSQFSPSQGKKTLTDFGFPKNVYTIGRLDYDSEGLLLLTNDWKLKHRLENPKFQHPRIYVAQVEEIPDEHSLKQLRNGVRIKDSSNNTNYTTLPAEVELLDEEPTIFSRSTPIRFRKNIPTSWLKIILREGKNRQVRKMTAAVGFPTLRLVRIGIGKINMSSLKPGEWRVLTEKEIRLLF